MPKKRKEIAENIDLATAVESLGLPTLTVNALIKKGIRTVREITLLSERELERVTYIGKKGMDEIRKIVVYKANFRFREK